MQSCPGSLAILLAELAEYYITVLFHMLKELKGVI